MTRVYIKKGYNRISVINLSKTLKHQAHAQGVPIKKYEKRGFNAVVLSNLVPKLKGQKVNNGFNGRKSHNECRAKERTAARLLRNSEPNEKDEAKSNANE